MTSCCNHSHLHKLHCLFGLVMILVISLTGCSVNGAALKLQLLSSKSYPLAVCNDGSSAGFYYRPASIHTSRWIFHLAGGWWCWDDKSCTDREASSPWMTSSSHWKQTLSPGGIFDPPLTAPQWLGVHHVYIPYCSSDAWAGNGSSIVGSNQKEWQFRGQEIVMSVFKHFFDVAPPKGPQEILFSGCSAGAQGLLYNLDGVGYYLSTRLAKGTMFKGFADSGWMMNFPSVPHPSEDIHTQFHLGYNLWKVPLFTPCFNVNTQEPWDCLFSPAIIPFITIPVLIQSSAYDSFQIPYDCCNPPFNTTEDIALATEIATATRNSMRHLIRPPHSVYSPSCFTHCLSESNQFSTVRIPFTLNQKLSNWFFQLKPDIGPLIDSCGFNCSLSCK